MHKLRICTYNIHKGFSHFNRRMVVHELRARLRQLNADVIFLQEVQGMHSGHALRHADWPQEPQHEFLAHQRWSVAYGSNSAYDKGHHGNAVLSRYDILSYANHDVTQSRLEKRGLLHCEINVPHFASPVHCICVHLSLTERQRHVQLATLAQHVEQRIPADAPLIIAGDFNDWRNSADGWLATRLNLQEAFTLHEGRPARSFPSNLPVLRLDRIYLRGFDVRRTLVHCGRRWSGISDHAALTADISLR